ncbi:LuxR C-terminal-related transcriptional regulator [Actinoplanes sp. NBC_00393]|uniref:ATP-binding protein n=1 Tax=Actinoplanes sp. NBC_00393 TaxID=2975953 RepID=UPI002E1CA6CE
MILGRRSELQELEALSARAVAGEGGALVLRGEAGIGKSALLEHAAREAAAQHIRVLETAGVQAEVHIPYAGLHRLLRTVPELSGAAVEILGSPDTLPFRAAAALLDLISEADVPMLIAVEDLQWLDEASWDALAFAARRLRADRAAMLLTARDGEDVDRRLTRAGLAEIRLHPLGDEDSRELLRRVAPTLTPGLAGRVLDAAGGNPLGLVELGEAASRSGGAALLPNWLPLSERLQRTFSGLVAELPAATRELLLVVALNDGDDLGEMLRARPGAQPDDLEPAVVTRLVHVDEHHRVRFRHPLLRSALYQSATIAQRRRVHAALAEAVAADPQRSVWHRAAAASGPDEELARQLTETAMEARYRQAAGIAITAFERAAKLSEDPLSRGQRLVAALDAANEEGDPERSRRLLAELEGHPLEPGDRMLYELIRETYQGTRWTGAERLEHLAEAVEKLAAAGEVIRAVQTLCLFALRVHFSDPGRELIDRLVTVVDRLAGMTDDPQTAALMALIAPVERGAVAGRRLRAALVEGGADPYVLSHLGIGAGGIGDSPAVIAFTTAAEIGLRAQGRLGVLARVLIARAAHAAHLGDSRIAITSAVEGVALALEAGERNWVPTAWIAEGAGRALRGDIAGALQQADAIEAALLPAGPTPLLSGVSQVRGIAALAAGRPEEAFRELRRILDPADPHHHRWTGFLLVGHLADAAVGCGALAELRQLVDELTPAAEQGRSPALLRGLGYARAVLTDTDEGYEQALADDLTEWPFEQARRRHAYGAWLRRRRRPAESRPLLRAAAATFDALGATAWADRSRAELRASGESLRRPTDTTAELTPQETQIARLAAEGLSNREIAERLFLSPRTVTTHLSRIYPKLGIRSRAELARVAGIT